MTKIIFFDIDGTLVALGRHEIAEDAKAALDSLRASGIKVFIASGRHKCVMDNLHGYPFDGYICTNGSLITVGKEAIYRHPICREDAVEIVRIAYERNIPCLAYLEEILRINFQTDKSMKVFDMLRIVPPESGDLHRIAEEVPVFEFTPVMTAEQEAFFTPYLRDTVFVRWHPDFVDLNPVGVNKAGGIEQVLKYYGFSREESMAFGDGENDIQMLDYAGISVAMGNAPDGVKAHADYVTAATGEGGISSALRHFGLI